jgi:serine/threonine-protein kinase
MPLTPHTKLGPFEILSLLGAILAGVAVRSLTRPAPLPVTRFAIHLPPGDEFVPRGGLAISPDGQNLVYVARRGSGASQLYVRPIDELGATPLPGTEGAQFPFFSPDGQWIGFLEVVERKLKKVPLSGGPPLTLCDVGGLQGASWGPDDTILLSTASQLLRVSASGGTPEPVTRLDPGEEGQGQRWPEILPGGQAVLYTTWPGVVADASIAVQSLETGERRILVEGGTNPRYVPTGHIVFARTGWLLAVPFDLERLEVTGSPVPVLEGVGQFSLSREGSLLYVSGTASSRKLVWVDRQGVERPVTETLRVYGHTRLSPDGQRLAVDTTDAGTNVWLLELGRDTLTRLTFEGSNVRPLWSPGGERVLFGSNRAGVYNIFSQPADGSGTPEQLTTGAYRIPTSVSSDGKTIVFRQNSDTTGRDIGMVRLESEAEPEMLLQTPFNEHSGMLSPDDRWLAYVSNESGREEIYVTPFPGPGGKWQVSAEGGTEPLWSRDGRELFYRSGEKMMAVPISSGQELTPGKPTLLFEGRYQTGLVGGDTGSNYDVAADGRFVMIRAEEGSGPTQINVVLNWFEELKRLVPASD